MSGGIVVSHDSRRSVRDPRIDKLRTAASFYRTAALVLLVIVGVQAGVIIWQAHRSRFARAIRVNNEVVCFVRNDKVAEQVRAALLAQHKGDLPGAPFLEQKWEDLNWPMDRDDKVLSIPEAVELVNTRVTIKVAAAAITAGDRELVVLPTKETAQDALDLLKKEYSDGPGKLLEARFEREDIRIADTKVQPRAILTDVREAVKHLKAPFQATEQYLVKPGYSWRKMAAAHGLSFDQLRKLNPEFSDVAPTGKHIKVPARARALTVITIKEETREAPVKAEPQLVPTEALPEGERRVTRPGVDGKKLITQKVTYRNGVEVERRDVSEVVTVEATPERIMVGTAAARPG